MPLRSRPPTGLASWPLILLDGIPKSGKTCTSLELSASPLVGDTFVFQIGERAADEYQALGRYQIIDELDGTWADFYDQMIQATLMPRTDPDRPNVIILDSGTDSWSGLRDWVDTRARNSEAAKALLRKDPDAAITRGQNLWNDANDRWSHLLKLLATWDGIAIITARGDEVTAYENGQPAANNRKEYRADIQKDTMSLCTANVSIRDFRQPRLVALTKLGFDLPASGLDLPREGALAHLIFEIIGVTAANRQTSNLVGVSSTGGYLSGATKAALIDAFEKAGFTKDEAKSAAAEVWRSHYPEGTTVDSVPQSVWEQMHVEIVRRTTPEAPAETPAQATEDPAATNPAPDPQEEQAEAPAAESGEPDASGPETRFPDGRDPVAEARAAVEALGGNPDAPSADPEESEGFDYDDEDDGEPTS